MVNISITLDPSPQGRMVYYPGQRISGVVQLDLSEPKKFRGFYVLIGGKAKCHWTERRTRSVGSGKNRRTESYTVYYHGEEIFLNSRTYLFGHHGAEATQIAAGTYKYNFMVELPPLLPATLAGSFGGIDYKVEAVLDIPWRFDKEIKVPFTVIRHDNLNDYPELKIPMKQEEIKTFCCLFCASDPCIITVSIPHGGFAAGQVIPVKIEYANKSNSDVIRTRIKLKRTFSFTSSTPEHKTRSDTDKMVEIYDAGVKGGESKVIECPLEIPGIMVSSNSRFCRVVQISYFLEVECEVDGCHSNPVLRFPITIGTVGIGDFDSLNQVPISVPNGEFTPLVPPQMPVYPQSVPTFAPTAPKLTESLDNDLPPTFEEAMNLNIKSQLEKSAFLEPQASSLIGWAVPSVPSAPIEKM